MTMVVFHHLTGSKINKTEQFKLDDASELTLGRDPSCSIAYDPNEDEFVSRRHAVVRVSKGEKLGFTLQDLNSANGTFLDDRKVSAEIGLWPGQTIELGSGGPKVVFDVEPRPAHLVALKQPVGPETRLIDAESLNVPKKAALTSASADPILYWNDVALEANRTSQTDGMSEQTGPTLASRALAIVHLAMYDAYAGVVNDLANLPPYLTGLPAPAAGASAAAAVAAAAHSALSALFPSQRAFFDLRHLQAGLSGAGLNKGHDFGLLVAQRLLADRAGDPNASDNGYAASVGRGAHRPDPDNPDQRFYSPFYGARSKGFAITKRHGLDAPPRPGDAEYLTALREVRGKGIAPELMGTLPPSFSRRNVDETLIGIFWAYDGAAQIGTPPRFYNQIVRTVAIAKGNSVSENVRLFALVNAAMADAGILAWDQKYRHNLWRPILGIREHDVSLGPAGTGNNNISNDFDTAWLPLGAPASNSLTPTRSVKNFTPNFPAYPSGHATFGAAALHMTRLFYGKKDHGPDDLLKGLAFVSDELNGVTRDNRGAVRPKHTRNFHDGLWGMIEENARSRIFLGVHWVFDAFAVKDGEFDMTRNVGGVPLGLKIAEDIFNGGRANGLKKSTVPPRP